MPRESAAQTGNSTGADLIAQFIATHCETKAFLVTGGACAFIVDAIARNPGTDYICFQHEQAAAMAADAVWRVSGRIGVTVATSGPGATNLVTGIACSWFDSIPSLHITGQVNDSESRVSLGAKVRQAGFQETEIVSIVKPITKFAVQVHSAEELVAGLREGLRSATSGRMGPVLIDVPMNVQKAAVPPDLWNDALDPIVVPDADEGLDWPVVEEFIAGATRPLVIIGGGATLSGSSRAIQNWCESEQIPYVASWSAMPSLDRSQALYRGSLGVYGSPRANWAVQAADRILALGTRLDNRQRSGNPRAFAPFAELLVIDIDEEELAKFSREPNYTTLRADLSSWTRASEPLARKPQWKGWREALGSADRLLSEGTDAAVAEGELNPYAVIRQLQGIIPPTAIVVSDCGANLCWVYQSFVANDLRLFTAAGNSPMGYSLPAAIGAKIASPSSDVWCIIGDGGMQMNIQELQTIIEYGLDIVVVVLNNRGYGIIKQFQDAYFGGRHEASGRGYSVPNFENIGRAYGLDYLRVDSLDDITDPTVATGPCIIDVMLPEGALITPKLEMDRFLHDQFPYSASSEVAAMLPVRYPTRPSLLIDSEAGH